MPKQILEYTEAEVRKLVAADAAAHAGCSVHEADVRTVHGGFHVVIADRKAKTDEAPAPRRRTKPKA